MGRRDAGVQVCEGTAQPCSEQPTSTCDSVPGCSTGTCSGSASSCYSHDWSSDCSAAGCDWDYEFDWCEGSPYPCHFWGNDRSRCDSVGCSWVPTDSCSGATPECSRLGRADCTRTPGCNLVGELPADLGLPLDSGPGDAGPQDAGGPVSGMCRGTICEIGSETDCSSGQGCYLVSDSSTNCLPAGDGTEGSVCEHANGCLPGLACVVSGDSANGLCQRICCEGDSSQCGSGSYCLEFSSRTDGAGACSISCDPLAGTGCPAGYACQVYTMGVDCGPAGTGVQGSPCNNSSDCAAGFACLDADGAGECLAYCDGTCDDPTLTCNPITGFEIGACR